MTPTDVSIDLETLGTAPGSVITQVGIALFNQDSVISSHNIRIDPQSALDHGMTVSWATIQWWLQQSDSARMGMVGEGFDGSLLSLPLALATIRELWAHHCLYSCGVWGHGCNFDIVLLEEAFRRVNLAPPWMYYKVRDLRTLAALAPEIEPIPAVLAHDAESDARAQANWIIDLRRQLERPVHEISTKSPALLP